MAKAATYRELFEFKWPPDLPSIGFRRPKRYEHTVVVLASDNDPENGVVLSFPNEKAARAYAKSAELANPKPIVEYIKKPVPIVGAGGLIQ